MEVYTAIRRAPMPIDGLQMDAQAVPRYVPREIERSAIRGPVWPHVLMALFGAGWAVSFDFGVRIYGAEIVSILGLLLIRWRPVFIRYPMLRRILAAYSLWVLAIVISDIVNGSALFDSARNMATPIIGGASLVCVLSALSRNPSALMTFLAATAIAKGILGEPAYGDAFADLSMSWESIQQDTNFFKVRIDPFLTPALLLLACWIGRRNLLRAAIVFAVASIGYFALDSRSSGFVFFLSALTLAAFHTGFRPRPAQIVVAGAVASLIGYVGFVAYVNHTLVYNPYGHNGKQLQRMENPYNPLELLLEGRSQWTVIPTAFAERPLFGWGSWAEDEDGRFTYMLLKQIDEIDYNYFELKPGRFYMPAHSLIGATVVWSGLLGFVAMAWFLRSVWTMSLRLSGIVSPLLPAVVALLMLLLLHYFFSPPMVVRLNYPVALAALIALTRDAARAYRPTA